MKKTLAVLFGGCSSEYDVSLHSAAAVMRAVDKTRYELIKLGITRMGQWLLYNGGIDAIEDDSWHRHPSCTPALLSPSREDHGLWLMREDGCTLKTLDLCLPVLHGKYGEDGTVQGLLELAGIPVAGCSSLASALCMDKEMAHRVAMQAGISCPRFVSVHRGGNVKEAAQQVMAGMQGIPFPWFIKPARAGSSFGITRIQEASQVSPALAEAFRHDNKAVVEEGVEGFEVGCAILGSDAPRIGTVDAIQLAGGFFNYHEKYTLESAQILLPAPLSAADTARVKATALQLYHLLGCSGFARVDLFFTPGGNIIFNEVNTIPGMTNHSRFPGMLQHAGLPFAQMVQTMLEQAV